MFLITEVIPVLFVVLFLVAASGILLALCLRKGSSVKTKPNTAYVYYNTNAFPKEGLIFTDPIATLPQEITNNGGDFTPPPPLPPPFTPSPAPPSSIPVPPFTPTSTHPQFYNRFDTATPVPCTTSMQEQQQDSSSGGSSTYSGGYQHFFPINHQPMTGKIRSHTIHTSMIGGLSSIGEEEIQLTSRRGSCKHLEGGYYRASTPPIAYNYREPAGTMIGNDFSAYNTGAQTPTSIMRSHTATLPNRALFSPPPPTPTPTQISHQQLQQQMLSPHYSIKTPTPIQQGNNTLAPHSTNISTTTMGSAHSHAPFHTATPTQTTPRITLLEKLDSVNSSRCERSQTFSGPGDSIYMEMQHPGTPYYAGQGHYTLDHNDKDKRDMRREASPRLLRSQSDTTKHPHYVNYIIPLPLSRQSTPETLDTSDTSEEEYEKDEEEKDGSILELTRQYNKGAEDVKHDYVNMKMLPLRSESQQIMLSAGSSVANTPMKGSEDDGDYIKMWALVGRKVEGDGTREKEGGGGGERKGDECVPTGNIEGEDVDAVHDYVNMIEFHNEWQEKSKEDDKIPPAPDPADTARETNETEPKPLTETKNITPPHPLEGIKNTPPDPLEGAKNTKPDPLPGVKKAKSLSPRKNGGIQPDELMAQLSKLETEIQNALTETNQISSNDNMTTTTKEMRIPLEENEKYTKIHRYVNISFPASPVLSPKKTITRTPSDPNISLSRYATTPASKGGKETHTHLLTEDTTREHTHEAIQVTPPAASPVKETQVVSEDTLVFFDKTIEGYMSEVTVFNWSDGTTGLTSATSHSTVV